MARNVQTHKNAKPVGTIKSHTKSSGNIASGRMNAIKKTGERRPERLPKKKSVKQYKAIQKAYGE